jgi:uncharacterized membrane protein YciS (DUF1049 family)
MFTAGHIESTNIKNLNLDVYNIVKEELDSTSVKISTKKTKHGVNYVAFLIKADVQKESILTEVEKTTTKTIITFELEYKSYGVICENGLIIDYLIDNPNEYAIANDINTKEISNKTGHFLVKYNLLKEKNSFRLSVLLLVSFVIIFIITLILAFFYIKDYSQTINKKTQIINQYQSTISQNFNMIKSLKSDISIPEILNEVEEVCKELNILLINIKSNNNNISIEFENKNQEELEKRLSKNYKFIKQTQKGLIYSYEKL